MFLNRLTSFKINPRKQTGLIVEINRLLQKYNLEHILDVYLNDGMLPGKFALKRMIKTKAHENAWYERVSNSEINRFSVLHSDFSPHWAWRFFKNNRKMLKPCIDVVQLLSSVSSLSFIDNICCHCHINFVHLLDHCIHDCIYLNRPRAQFLQEISSLSTDLYMYLSMQDKQMQTNLLLGVETPEFFYRSYLIDVKRLNVAVYLLYT